MSSIWILLTVAAHCATAVGRPKTPREGFLTSSKSFNFRIECGPWNNATCQAAKDDLMVVGNLIASELFFKVPVNVCVNVADVPLPAEHELQSPDVANMTMIKMSSTFALI